MIETHELATRFEAYADWRRRLGASLAALAGWLDEHGLADARAVARLSRLREGLDQDQLTVALVAEFSRGKSELVNALLFAESGRRLLPSSAGRTTMCPTELLFDPSEAPSLRLLPIETRARDAGVAAFRKYPDEWVRVPLDLASPAQMSEALQRLGELKRVPAALAACYGLADAAEDAPEPAEAEVEIPCWRHAIVNFPHPLLREGLVILDTPGLNAIGMEPDLTLSLLADAHVVLFVLAADAGVTRTDLDVWTRHLAGDEPAGAAQRLVVLNKIDVLWDELRSAGEIDAEIRGQVDGAAEVLGVPRAQVFAVSAQKALVAKVNGDDALLAKSGLPGLEAALSDSLLPAKRDLVGQAVRAEVRALAAEARAILGARRAGVARQIAELASLRGKNQDVVAHMMARVRDEKAAFERGLQRYSALRSVFTEQTNRLYDGIGQEALRRTAERTREAIAASPFTKGIRAAMAAFFAAIRADLDRAAAQAAEIQAMMQAMYARFAAERGLERFHPPPFSMLKYQKELERLERAYNTQLNTLWNMLSKAKSALMQRFFETIAARVRHLYDVANRDVEAWLRATMAPLESQVKEQHGELRRRLESIRRIHHASGELEERVAELREHDAALAAEEAALDAAVAAVDGVVVQPELLPLAANG